MSQIQPRNVCHVVGRGRSGRVVLLEEKNDGKPEKEATHTQCFGGYTQKKPF